MRDLLIALGFMTRLAPARSCTVDELGRSIAWLPAVGLILGLTCAGPVILGLGHGYPLAQGLFVAASSLYLTRGLHWDGLADLGDAWGSGASDARFWEILKDSRMGAFGGMALALGLPAQYVTFAACLQSGQSSTLLFSFILGRGSCVLLARAGCTLARPGLGNAFLAGTTSGRVAAALLGTVAAGLVLMPLPALGLALALAGLTIQRLLALARRQGGLNGDFLGACIVLGEMAPGLALILLGR